MQTEVFQRGAVGRMRIHVLPTTRFKTFSLSLFAGVPLEESRVTPVALAPFVLRRGTRSYPETIQFRERLDELYGAGFGFDIYKRGDYQIVQFRLDIINDAFVSSSQSLLEEALRFLGEALTEPALEGGAFSSKYVESEKTTVQKRIESIINDKIRYAAERCLEEMCRNEPYRLLALGRKEELPQITPASLYESYRKWLDEAVFDLYVSGDTSLEQVAAWAGQYFKLPDGQPGAYRPAEIRPASEAPRTIVERLDVGQGKLNLGLRTGIAYSDGRYPDLLVYNGILGAFPHSKLFIHVREKASLAYYASSRLDGHKGLLTIQSGIEIANYERALDIIRQQLEEMRAGNIEEQELSKTKAMLVNQLREIQDSAFERIAFDYNGVVSGKERSADELIASIGSVTADSAAAVAAGVGLDTIYFLRDLKEEAAHVQA